MLVRVFVVVGVVVGLIIVNTNNIGYRCEIKKNNETIVNLENIIQQKEEIIEDLKKENALLLEELKNYEVMSIPNVGDKKTYMDYCSLSTKSKQGDIVYDEEAWTDEDGLRRWGKYYCVALGSYYGEVGDKFFIETDNGNKYKVIKADEKDDRHTDSSNRYTVATNCMMEWIVETNKLNSFVKNSGNINNIDKVSGNIIKIIKIKG